MLRFYGLRALNRLSFTLLGTVFTPSALPPRVLTVSFWRCSDNGLYTTSLTAFQSLLS